MFANVPNFLTFSVHTEVSKCEFSYKFIPMNFMVHCITATWIWMNLGTKENWFEHEKREHAGYR